MTESTSDTFARGLLDHRKITPDPNVHLSSEDLRSPQKVREFLDSYKGQQILAQTTIDGQKSQYWFGVLENIVGSLGHLPSFYILLSGDQRVPADSLNWLKGVTWKKLPAVLRPKSSDLHALITKQGFVVEEDDFLIDEGHTLHVYDLVVVDVLLFCQLIDSLDTKAQRVVALVGRDSNILKPRLRRFLEGAVKVAELPDEARLTTFLARHREGFREPKGANESNA